MNFIARHINAIGILLLTAFASATAALYWGVPQPIKQVRAASPATAQFVCPMHPKVTSSKSGDCSSCGMKLVAASNASMPAASSAPSGCTREEGAGCCGSKAGAEMHAGCNHGQQSDSPPVAANPKQ